MRVWFRKRSNESGSWLEAEMAGTAGPMNGTIVSLKRKNKPLLQLEAASASFGGDVLHLIGYKAVEKGDNRNFVKVSYHVRFTKPKE